MQRFRLLQLTTQIRTRHPRNEISMFYVFLKTYGISFGSLCVRITFQKVVRRQNETSRRVLVRQTVNDKVNKQWFCWRVFLPVKTVTSQIQVARSFIIYVQELSSGNTTLQS